jgi:hypothetical protein
MTSRRTMPQPLFQEQYQDSNDLSQPHRLNSLPGVERTATASQTENTVSRILMESLVQTRTCQDSNEFPQTTQTRPCQDLNSLRVPLHKH